MGDILGSILGTSSTQQQTTTPDVFQQAMNQQRLQQLINFFSVGGGVYQFANPERDLYSPGDQTWPLIDAASQLGREPVDYNNLMSLEDYRWNAFTPTEQSYNTALSDLGTATGTGQAQNVDSYNRLSDALRGLTAGGLNRSYADYATGTGAAANTYGQVSGDVQADYNSAIARGDYDLARQLMINREGADRALASLQGPAASVYGSNEAQFLRSLGLTEQDALRALTQQEYGRSRALDLGLRETDNYISQIATPRINQAMTLQGLERGGAIPAAIARATAETAMPYLQGIESLYGTNTAGIMNNLMSLRAGLGQNITNIQSEVGRQVLQQTGDINAALAAQNAAAGAQAAQGNTALGGQLMSLQGAAGNTYQNNVAQLAQALMNNNISLEQAGITANSALGQQLMQAQNALRLQQQQGITSLASTYMPLQNSFAQSLPGASATLSMLPQQLQAAKASTLMSLLPATDFQRQLKEQDFLRRQGLFTSLYTGIPFQPGTTTQQSSATGNLFNQVGGLFESFGTGGTSGGSGIT